MKLKKSKLLNLGLMIFGLSVLSVSLSSCQGGSNNTNSNQIMPSFTRVNLSSDFVTANPMKVNHSYVLSVTDSSGDTLSSQIFECSDLKACTVDLEDVNMSSSDFVYIRVFNGEGGLVAASLMNTTQFVSDGNLNSTKISLSEYSTGIYILSKMQQISNVLYSSYNDGIKADFMERFHLQNVEHPQEVIPMVAYKLANQLGLDEGEASGVFRLWYNIYGDADEYDNVSASMINKSAAHLYHSSATSSISRASSSKQQPMAPIPEVDSGDEDDGHKPDSLAMKDFKNKNKQLIKKINQLNNNDVVDQGKVIGGNDTKTPQAVQQKADQVIPKQEKEKKGFDWITTVEASNIAKQLGKFAGNTRPPVTGEERATAEIISNVFSVVFKAVNAYAPGLGSVFGMLNTFALEAYFPTQGGNPNAALEAKITQLNSSVENLTTEFNQRMDQQDIQTLDNAKAARQKVLDEGLTLAQPYLLYISTGISNSKGEESNNVLAGAGYPGFLDVYIQTSSSRKNALNQVKALFGSKEEARSIVNTAKAISSADNINVYMTALNNVRNNMKANVVKGSGDKDYVIIDEGYYAKVLAASTATMNALEQLRNYQLAAAYLMRNSHYKDEIGTIYISDDAGKNLEDYDMMVSAINAKYKTREIEAMEAFKNATQPSTVYKDTERWTANVVKKTSDDKSKSCVISYWNGKDLGIMCEKEGLRGSNISTQIYDIAKVCKEMLVKQGTHVYCNINVTPNLAYFSPDKFMTASSYNSDETCDWWVFGCETKSYNKMFIDAGFNVSELKNSNTITYVKTVNSRELFNVNLKKDGNLDGTIGNGYTTSVGKPFTDRYVTYSNHKVWLLSSYNTHTIVEEGMTFPDNTPTFTLGCLTSDCLLYKRPNGVTELFYPDLDHYFTMDVTNPQDEKSYVSVGVKTITAKDSAGLPRMREPFGDWVTQCNIDTMTYNNDILTATCTNGAWNNNSDQIRVSSALNYRKSCKLGSYVTVEKSVDNPVLKCVEPRVDSK